MNQIRKSHLGQEWWFPGPPANWAHLEDLRHGPVLGPELVDGLGVAKQAGHLLAAQVAL